MAKDVNPFDRSLLKNATLRSLHEGCWANARIDRFAHSSGEWVVKDFSERHCFVKNLIGRFLVRRESMILQKLNGVFGVPQDVFRLDEYALCYRYRKGVSLGRANELKLGELGRDFFLALENILKEIHEHGVVHLDARNGGNIMKGDDGLPFVLDFQSSFDVRKVPGFLKQILLDVDLSGVYKYWMRFSPDTLDDHRKALFDKFKKRRNLWPFRGYWWRKKRNEIVVKLRKEEPTGFEKYSTADLINSIFNHIKVRKVLVSFRVPLTLAAIFGLFFFLKPEYYIHGLVTSMVGELIQLWCFASLKKQKILATMGPYLIVRNPMYLGRYFIILGGIVMTGSVVAVALYTILYYFYMVNRVKREEKTLSGIFGNDYQEYCRKVNRFLPAFKGVEWHLLWYWKWALFKRNHGPANLAAVIICYVVIYAFLVFSGRMVGFWVS